MADDLPAAQPALGKLEVGDEVLVVERGYHRRAVKEGVQPIRATVTSKARVWITVEKVDGPTILGQYRRTWRLRLDHQTDGSDSAYAVQFYTFDQWRFHQAHNEAREYLTEQGIRIDWDSPWKRREIELARGIWSLLNPDDLAALRRFIERRPPLGVSVDVSTGDHDYDRRIFGTVAGVQADSNGAPIILVEHDSQESGVEQ
jgi:hypothetical protein